MKDFVINEESGILKFIDGILSLFNAKDTFSENEDEKINYSLIFNELTPEICFEIIFKYFEESDNIYGVIDSFGKPLLYISSEFNPKYMMICIMDYHYYNKLSK